MYIYSLPDPAVHADPIFPSFLLFSPLLEVTATVWWWCPPSFYLLIVEIKNLTLPELGTYKPEIASRIQPPHGGSWHEERLLMVVPHKLPCSGLRRVTNSSTFFHPSPCDRRRVSRIQPLSLVLESLGILARREPPDDGRA